MGLYALARSLRPEATGVVIDRITRADWIVKAQIFEFSHQAEGISRGD